MNEECREEVKKQIDIPLTISSASSRTVLIGMDFMDVNGSEKSGSMSPTTISPSTS